MDQHNASLGYYQAQFGSHCTRPHYPDDAVEHAKQRFKQIGISIKSMEEELEKLKLEKHQLEKMLGALDAR